MCLVCNVYYMGYRSIYMGTHIYNKFYQIHEFTDARTHSPLSPCIKTLHRPLPFPYFFISFLFYITFYSSQFKSPPSMRFTQTVVFLCIATGNAIGVSSITTARWKNITFFHIRKISHRACLMLQKIGYRC